MREASITCCIQQASDSASSHQPIDRDTLRATNTSLYQRAPIHQCAPHTSPQPCSHASLVLVVVVLSTTIVLLPFRASDSCGGNIVAHMHIDAPARWRARHHALTALITQLQPASSCQIGTLPAYGRDGFGFDICQAHIPAALDRYVDDIAAISLTLLCSAMRSMRLGVLAISWPFQSAHTAIRLLGGSGSSVFAAVRRD